MLSGPRPPDLAAALGGSPDAVFSLALPGLTALGAIALYQRHRNAFPRLRALVVGVDEPFLNGDEAAKNLQLTALSPAARWRYAGRSPVVADRVGVLAAAWFPLLDAKGLLDVARDAKPGAFWRRLAGVDVPDHGHAALMHRSTWRWGLPPVWDYYPPAELARMRRDHISALALVVRAGSFFPPKAARNRAHNLADLADLLASARAEGLDVTLLRPPYEDRMRVRLPQLAGAAGRAYDADLDAFLAGQGLAFAATPSALPAAACFDPDHLAPAGSRRLACDLAFAAAPLRAAVRD
jgi:hypothetical protein